MGPPQQYEVVQPPVMPVTPVNVEALMTLQGLINRNAHALDDERSKWRLQWYAEKLAGAAKISFADRALQQDQVRFLFRVNKEAKVRRSTKFLILGKAKVMSYEDLEVAGAKRAAKEKAKATAGTGKAGRKLQNAAPEAEEATADKKQRRPKRKSLAPEAGSLETRSTPVVRMSETSEPARAPVGRLSEAPELARATVARMI